MKLVPIVVFPNLLLRGQEVIDLKQLALLTNRALDEIAGFLVCLVDLLGLLNLHEHLFALLRVGLCHLEHLLVVELLVSERGEVAHVLVHDQVWDFRGPSV